MEQAARLIIEAVGEDPEREGLVETPRRFAEMMAEQLAYAGVPNEEIARAFDKTFSSPESDMVVVKDISLFFPLRAPYRPHVQYEGGCGIYSQRARHRTVENCPHRRCRL